MATTDSTQSAATATNTNEYADGTAQPDEAPLVNGAKKDAHSINKQGSILSNGTEARK